MGINGASAPCVDPRVAAILNAYPFHREGDTPPAPPAELVEGMLPKVGTALLPGQWGVLKTFLLIDLGVSVATGLPFAGRKVNHRGGVLILAAEGQQYIASRVLWAKRARATIEQDERLPIIWVNSCPKLTGRDALLELLVIAQAAETEFKRDFGLPLALIGVDAMTSAASFLDANNASEVSRVMRLLSDLAGAIQALAIVVDHFGKDPTTGTRNSSVKEDDADAVLAALAVRTPAGIVSDTRLAIRKYRGGPTGLEIPYEKRALEGGGIAIAWSEREPKQQAKSGDDRWPSFLGYLRGALSETLGKHGFMAAPFLDNLTVKVVKRDLARAEYLRRHPDEKNKAQCFRRHVNAAIERNCMMSREITLPDGARETVFWPIKPC
jgi:hypothetical protein